jgi:exoribonuclease R
MPAPEVHIRPSAVELAPMLDAVRREFSVPDSFPAAVLAEADAVCAAGGELPPGADAATEDARDLPFVTIDPEGSLDLDQAYVGERRVGGGFRVNYAIADVAWFVRPGGELDREANVRGVTIYQPDRRTSLHPEVLAQGAASLLADQDRRALLWTIDLDADALPVGPARFRRAQVRSRRQMSYVTAQAEIDAGTAGESLEVLREVGQRREQREAERGGISLRLPDQEVDLDGAHPTVAFRAPLPVEGWNAQISLLTGMVAADVMLAGRVGILRTLPPPEPSALEGLRQRANAVGAAWAPGVSYPDFVRSLDPEDTIGAVLLHQAARTLRGAGYTSFDGRVPDEPAHAAVAAPYAHVTAPLRRLVDRYANEVALALVAGREVPSWARSALVDLPETMAVTTRRAKGVERATLDGAEAVVLARRVGETFDATVIASDPKRSSSTVELADPAIVASLAGVATVGSRLRVRVAAADPIARTVRFEEVV